MAQQTTLYDIALQCSSLAAAGNCPGVYILQDEHTPLTLHGVLFPPSSGPYAGGVFRFTIQWTGSVLTTIKSAGRGDVKEKTTVKKTLTTPIVTFQQGLSHPLIHSQKQTLSLIPRFPSWKPRQHTLSSLLFYIKECFGSQLLEEVKAREGWWTNAEMGRLLRNEPTLFQKLCRQSVSLSTAKSNLYGLENGGRNNEIQFGELSEEEYEAVRKEILG